MNAWYAVYTQPHNETRAQEHLLRQEFEVLLPRYLKRTSHARKVRIVAAPLFPRYLFVAFDPDWHRWRAIRSTFGVVGLVGSSDAPTPVPQAVIDEIGRRQDQDGYVTLARQCGLKTGDRIRIDSGPFHGTEAIFQSQRDEDRVIALLSLMGREVLVQVPMRAIVPV